MLTSPTCATVEFELPDWCADSRFEYERKIYYSQGHVYAGQVNRIDLENKMSEALFTIDGMDEVCLHTWNCWCRVHIEYIASNLGFKRAKENAGGYFSMIGESGK